MVCMKEGQNDIYRIAFSTTAAVTQQVVSESSFSEFSVHLTLRIPYVLGSS